MFERKFPTFGTIENSTTSYFSFGIVTEATIASQSNCQKQYCFECHETSKYPNVITITSTLTPKLRPSMLFYSKVRWLRSLGIRTNGSQIDYCISQQHNESNPFNNLSRNYIGDVKWRGNIDRLYPIKWHYRHRQRLGVDNMEFFVVINSVNNYPNTS